MAGAENKRGGSGRSRFLLLAVFSLLLTAAPAWPYSQDQLDSVTTPEETQINRVRDQEIAQLKIVLGRRFAENRRPDILLRLAELYVEKYRFYFFKENQIHQILYKQGVKEKTVNHDRSRAQIQAATNACRAILQSRVPFAKLDEVYYFLGYNAEEMGDHREAAKYFGVVATRYQTSVYASEAFRNLGEYEFENNRFQKAVGYYERAAQFTSVPSYPRTLYKLAWAYFKTRRKSDALDAMKRVISVAGKEDKFVGLRDEAMGDIVLFFSEAGRLNEAHDFFSSLNGGPEIYAKALGKLADMYDRRGDRKLAIKVNEGVVAEYGDKRPDLVYEALAKNVELFRKMGDSNGEEGALKRLVDFFAAHGDAIAKASGEDASATYARTKSYLRGRATEVHKQARQKKSTALYSRAADLYSLYIKAFLSKPSGEKEEKERAEIEAYRSDALLAAGREGEAMPELEVTLTGQGDAKLRKDAGTTLLNILIKRLDAAHAKGKADAAAEASFLRISTEYEHAFPDDKLVADLRYKRARMAAGRSGPEGLNSDARDALTDLVQKYPDRPEAAEAARDLVNDLLKRKKTEEANTLARTYLANGPLMNAGKKIGLADSLRKVIEHQQFIDVAKEEHDASKSDDLAKSATSYETLANQSKDPEVAAKALNNAAVDFDRAGQTDEAFRVYLKILQRFPGNASPKAELKRLAAQFLWKSRFAEAARLYVKLAALPAFAIDERLSMARTAFVLQWGTGDAGGAVVTGSRALSDLCGLSVTRKGKKAGTGARPRAAAAAAGRGGSYDPRCHELVLDLAELERQQGRIDEAVAVLKSYVAHTLPNQRRAEAYFILGKIYGQNQDGRNAGLYYENASRAMGGAGHARGSDRRERNFAAHAAFLLVEPHFARFSALKLELPEDRLKATTRKKLSDLESLVTRYTSVVKYGDGEWGIAALERLYDAFSAFSTELERSPVPARLKDAQVDAYRRGIQGVTQPMMARALDYLKQAYQRGLELSVTTPTFVAVTQRLARRDARSYPPAHYAMSSGGDGGDASRQSSLRLSGVVETADAEELRKPDGAWRARVAAKLAQNQKNADAWIELGNIEALTGRLRVARLLYEQAVALDPKSAAALCDLSVVYFLDNDPVEATQGLKRAADIAGFSKDVKLDLAKSLLAYHHFGPALEALRGLSSRFPDDKDVHIAVAVATLGAGQLSQAGALLKTLDADDSKNFNLWYNWSVWAALAGDKDGREKAMGMLKDRRDNLGALEKAQADLASAVLSGGGSK